MAYTFLAIVLAGAVLITIVVVVVVELTAQKNGDESE